MSAVEVQPQEKGGLAGRDSAGFEWEDIPQPYTPSEHAHLIPPTATASFVSRCFVVLTIHLGALGHT